MIDRTVMHVTEDEKDALTFLRLLGSTDIMLKGQLPTLVLKHDGIVFRYKFGGVEATSDSPVQILAYLLRTSFNPPAAKDE